MQKKYFITGIGTDVGKTVVAAILTEALQADYWKPVQCGIDGGGDKQVVKDLVSNSKTVFHPESYVLKQPLSPNIAAVTEGIKIALEEIVLPQTTNDIIIEGAGGLMVPLASGVFVADLIKHLNAEVIVVVSDYLGNINHSLLTIMALKSMQLNVKGIVFNGNLSRDVEDTIMKNSPWPKLFNVNKHSVIGREIIASYKEVVINNLS